MMKQKILIVEDEIIVATNLKIILEKAGYSVCPIAMSFDSAVAIVEQHLPGLVLLDIFLQGEKTGIDLARWLREKGIGFVYISANSNQKVLDAAKPTEPYGFIVKPFREQDILVTLDIAHYLHGTNAELRQRKKEQPAVGPAPAHLGIIGESQALQQALQQVDIVAPIDTSVLILGDSGTGKERFADYIHAASSRKNKPFIKINCGALPSTLIESELFGHERGAFTGAHDKRIGKFEQAQGGTIFLDEIGELPLDLQPKLLRVLQEKEIERIGGRQPMKIDVRIIAGTNRILEKEVAEGRFRMDLYYRLNVFPVEIPTLRERKGDIPLLVTHFIRYFSQKAGKDILDISPSLLSALMEYPWPGNVRELEHYIERSVLLTSKKILSDVPLPIGLNAGATDIPTTTKQTDEPVKTLKEREVEGILAALSHSGGKIFGPGGAAELLGIPVATLNARIKKLGIIKERTFGKH